MQQLAGLGLDMRGERMKDGHGQEDFIAGELISATWSRLFIPDLD